METRGSKEKPMPQAKNNPPMEGKSTVPSVKSNQLSPQHLSELRLLYIIITSVFFAEVAAMFLIFKLPPLPYQYMTLIDAGVMTVLIFPVLYFLSFRPLTRHIEKRQQVERALQQKEELQARFFDSIHVLIAYMDRDFNFIRVNDAYAQADGQTPDYFIGKNHFDLFPHLENQRLFEQVIESGEPLSVYERPFEYAEHPERGVTYWDWSLQPVKGADGTVEGLVMSLLDVTQRKQAAEFVKKERQRFYDVLETLPVYVVLLTPDYHVSFANRVFSEHFGASQNMRCYEHLFGRSEPCEVCDTYKVLRTMAPTQWEWTGPNGHVYDVFDYPFTDTDGSPLILEMGIDITERKRAEEANRQLSRIVEQTEDTVVVTNREGMIEYVNPAFERRTGYTKEEALGKTPRVLKSNVHDSEFYQNLWNTILKGDAFQSEIANCKKNGEMFYEVKTITPLRDTQGNITHFVATGKDITEHKQDEEKLLKAYDELELRVEERTEELRIANSELEKEINERKQAEEAARQNAVMLRAVLEQMPSGVTVRDAQTGKLILSNVRSLEIMNALAEIPRQFAEYRGFYPNGRAYQSEEWPVYRSMATGEVVNAEEIECERSDGTRFTIVVSSAPIYNVDGKIVSGVSVFHDITERKQVERRLAYLASFPERNPNPVIEVDFDGQVRYANPATLSIFPDLLEQGTAHPWLAGLDTIFHGLRAGQNNITPRDVVVGEHIYQQSVYLLVQEQLIRIYGTDITERKQAEEALKESERRLNRAQEIAHLGSWELDLVNNRLTWSDEVYRIFGLQPQEFAATYEAFIDAVHPDDRAAVNESYSGSIREGRDSYEIEHRIVKRLSGEIRIVHEKCEHFRDEAGQIVRSVGMVHDITERKQAEEAVREAAERFRIVADFTYDWEYWRSPENHFHYISPSCKQITGYPREAFNDDPDLFLQIIHPDDRERLTTHYHEDLFREDAYEIEFRIIREDGQERWIGHTCRLVLDQQGQVLGRRASNRDITERKAAEAALRKAHDELELRVQERTRELANANSELIREIAERKEVERQLRIRTTAMEAAANGIIITDPHGNIQWTNPALTLISGYDAYDLLGQNMRIFRSGKNDPEYYRKMWDTILSGQVWRGETTNRRKDGTLYIEEQTITPVHDENGQIPHFIAIKQDITQRKRAEEELEQRNVELQIISNAEHNQRQFSEALVAAVLTLNSSLKLNEVLPLILNQIREVIPYQLADIALLEGDTFYDACHQGDLAWPASLLGVNNRFLIESFPLLNEMRQSGEPALVLDSEKEPDWITVDGMAWVRSLLSAPLLVEQKVIGFVNLFGDQPGFFTQEMSNRLVAFAAHAAVAIQNAWLFEQVQASTERLQSLSRRLVEIQENERLYISRELHDEAGQVLTSLLVDLQLLEKNISEPSILLKIVTEMESSLNAVIENLHRVAMALRPASLDHVGLVAALRQHVESVGEKHGLSVSFTANKVVERLPANVETVLYRIVQEALTNIVRHARASRVDVVLTVRDCKLIVIVEDDGIGFDPDSVSTDEHLGLFGMRERAEMIGGQLVIESAPSKGTTIVMEVGYADTVISR